MSRSILVPAEVIDFVEPTNISQYKAPMPIAEGTRFGRLTATEEYELRKRPDGRNRCYQKFVCDCGNALFLVGYSVKNGNTSSCGCIHTSTVIKTMTTHGESKTSEYHRNKQRERRAKKTGSRIEPITVKMLKNRLKEFNNKCWICDVDLVEIHWDHVHPLAKGGVHQITNLKPACPQCNVRKSSLWPFTDEMKQDIATAVRALRTAQAPTMPVTDGLEVHDVCLS